MTVAIQHASNSTKPSDSTGTINANLHFSVSDALTESKLLERVREYRRLSLEIASVNSELSEQQLAHRAQIMLQLKEASEHFNTLLSPVDVVHIQVLRQLKLEQILSKYYWHTLFLANNHPEQGKYELDSLCSKLLNAKYSLSVVGFDIVNSAVEIDADVYENSDRKPHAKTELPSISPEVLSVVTPNATTAVIARESVNFNESESRINLAQSRFESISVSGVISRVITGLSVLLLVVLAASVMAPDYVEKLQSLVPVGSWPFRLIMLVLLLALSTSVYLMISRVINTNHFVPDIKADSDASVLFGLFKISTSPIRLFACIVAPIFIGLGLGVATSAGIGSFGFALLIESLNHALSISLWLLLPVMTICLWLLAWFWGRVLFGIGTAAALLLIAPAFAVGAGFEFTDQSLISNVIIGNVITIVLGLILFSGGISLSAASALGPDGVTALSLAAERVHKWPVYLSILLWDLTAIAAGLIMGGSIGIATVVGLIAVPFLIRLFLPAFRRVVIS